MKVFDLVPQSEPPSHEANRLTTDDKWTIRHAVREALIVMAAGAPQGTYPVNVVELRRVAARSIGCGLVDLRESERDFIDEVIDAAMTPW